MPPTIRGGRLTRLLLGGLWAGVVWELLNYWAAVERARRHAALALHKGMGAEGARLLLTAGVDDVAALASADATAPVERLEEVAAREGVAAPGPAKVKV